MRVLRQIVLLRLGVYIIIPILPGHDILYFKLLGNFLRIVVAASFDRLGQAGIGILLLVLQGITHLYFCHLIIEVFDIDIVQIGPISHKSTHL